MLFKAPLIRTIKNYNFYIYTAAVPIFCKVINSYFSRLNVLPNLPSFFFLMRIWSSVLYQIILSAYIKQYESRPILNII